MRMVVTAYETYVVDTMAINMFLRGTEKRHLLVPLVHLSKVFTFE